MSKQEGASPHSSDHPKYRTAYAIADYLSENCEQNISLEELAAHFYLSKYYVCRTFKEITGYTVTEYTNIHRIRKAKRLLEETDMSISEIAHELGYESLTYFERMFKSFMTISPVSYTHLDVYKRQHQKSIPWKWRMLFFGFAAMPEFNH